ncbi:MAG: dephospho-CoA kinase, partial [Paludibacter sp.]
MKSPLLIGITGGIGSGKTTLSKKLRAEGYSVYDSDSEARRLQNEHPVIRKELIQLFGEDIYNNQILNRSALAKIVFGKPELLSKLNSVVHPFVKEDFELWIKKHETEKLLFQESAILFESGFNSFVDKVILMVASEDVRIARVMKRDGTTHEQVKLRMKNQMTDDEKIPKADFVIYTDDNMPLEDKMRRIL